MRADDDTDDAPPVSPVQAVALVAELLWAGRQAGTVSATFSAGGLAALQKGGAQLRRRKDGSLMTTLVGSDNRVLEHGSVVEPRFTVASPAQALYVVALTVINKELSAIRRALKEIDKKLVQLVEWEEDKQEGVVREAWRRLADLAEEMSLKEHDAGWSSRVGLIDISFGDQRSIAESQAARVARALDDFDAKATMLRPSVEDRVEGISALALRLGALHRVIYVCLAGQLVCALLQRDLEQRPIPTSLQRLVDAYGATLSRHRELVVRKASEVGPSPPSEIVDNPLDTSIRVITWLLDGMSRSLLSRPFGVPRVSRPPRLVETEAATLLRRALLIQSTSWPELEQGCESLRGLLKPPGSDAARALFLEAGFLAVAAPVAGESE